MKDSAHYVSELAPLLSSWWVFIMQVLPLHFGEISKISNHHILKANTKYSFFMKISAFSSYLKICLFALARLLHEIGANCKNYIGVSVLFLFFVFRQMVWATKFAPKKSPREFVWVTPCRRRIPYVFCVFASNLKRQNSTKNFRQ